MKKRITLLKTMLLAIFVLVGAASTSVFAQTQKEDFEGDTGLTTSYADGSFTNSSTGITWNYGHARDQENFPIEGKGLILRRASDSYLEATFPNGVGNFSFQYRKAFTGGNNNRQLELIVNGEQVAVTDMFGSSGEDNTVHDFSFDVNVAGEVTIKIKSVGESSSNAQVTLDNIAWTEKAGEATPKAATPTFNPAGGTYNDAQSVTISTATEGATIYYTTDGNNPTTSSTKYSAPVAINQTTTLKAIAVKSGLDNSSVATANYTIKTVTEVSNIAALHAAEVGGTYKLTGEALVTFLAPQNRNAKFIQDATGGVMVDDPDGKITTAYNVGDGMKGLVGTTALYGGLLQFVPVSDPGAPSSTGNTIVPKEVELDELADYESQLVEIKYITIDATGNFERGKNYGMNGEDNPILRTQYDLDYIGTPIPANEVNMVGVSIRFNEKIQFVPRSLADIKNSSGVEAVVTPVITPSTGSYTEDQTVTITTATEGATIYYTTNGQTPTKVSNKYSAPFTVTKTTTIKAIAIKSGMEDSGVAESVITMIDLSGTVGKGTKDDPFTVADVFTLNNTTGGSTKFWVKAFVVGAVNDKSFPDDLVLEGPFLLKTNLVVADDMGEKESENMVPVQLPGNNVRDALNLIDHPDVLHRNVLLYGTLERYFGVPGVKNVTDYVLVEDTGIKDLEIHNLYTTPGMIHFNATAGEMIELYNLAGQKLQNRLATEGLNSLPIDTQGVVILKVGNKVDKVIVR